MSRKEILEILRSCKKELSAEYGISKIGVFGSVARDEARDDSDIDIVIRIHEPDFFMLSGIKNLLQERLLKQVDVVTYRPGMNEFLKKRIDSEAVYV
ncbi:MAG: nucleotidyltransferase domain-containing protein [Candidatus Sabulitectum sp.]|nr:nucleotidyltransferase domain-containing protein [Candidatus Sabulitectum sp.]